MNNNKIDDRRGSNYGESNGQSKLTQAKVFEIKSRPNSTQRELAKEYGVNQSTISLIRSGKLWR